MEVPGRTHAQRWGALYEVCSEGYFETLGPRPLRGRMLSAQDVADGRKVAVGVLVAENYCYKPRRWIPVCRSRRSGAVVPCTRSRTPGAAPTRPLPGQT